MEDRSKEVRERMARKEEEAAAEATMVAEAAAQVIGIN
jgi:hypothetical protein